MVSAVIPHFPSSISNVYPSIWSWYRKLQSEREFKIIYRCESYAVNHMPQFSFLKQKLDYFDLEKLGEQNSAKYSILTCIILPNTGFWPKCPVGEEKLRYTETYFKLGSEDGERPLNFALFISSAVWPAGSVGLAMRPSKYIPLFRINPIILFPMQLIHNGLVESHSGT